MSHRCTEFEGREWKNVFPLSIHDKRCFVPYGMQLTGQALIIDQ